QSNVPPILYKLDPNVSVVFVGTNPFGGLDVYNVVGSHSYASIGNYAVNWLITFDNPGVNSIQPIGSIAITFSSSNDDQTSSPQQIPTLFVVSEPPLTAGALTPPRNAAKGQPISNAVLFHFADADPKALASGFTATVTWGDGTTNSSNDASGT